MTVEEGLEFFQNIPRAATRLQTLLDVGLGYVKLGQTAPTLSGGELVAVGTPEQVAKNPRSHTRKYLKQVLKQHSAAVKT